VKRIVLPLALVLIGGFMSAPTLAAGADAEPTTSVQTRTPIKHFVAVMQQNHSFDNYFGTFPGADGIPSGACMPAEPPEPEPCIEPFAMGDRGRESLPASSKVFDAQYADGAMNGFVSALSTNGPTSDIAMGHYGADDIPYYWSLAERYVLFDRYFSSAKGGTMRNHMYWVTGTPGNPESELVPSAGFGDIPTIFDRLEQKGVSWKFYVQNYDPDRTFRTSGRRPVQVLRAPLLAFSRFVDDPELASHIVSLDEYYEDVQRGTLPAVSYVVTSGPSEQPPGGIKSGEALVRSVITALERSPAWPDAALMLSYDDWGGWYDHVAPPQVDEFGLGFRVPALLVSAYAKRGHIDHTPLEHTSMLKFIERNWGLEPLAARDAAANDFLSAFDFTQAPRPAEIIANDLRVASVKDTTRGIIYPAYGGAVILGVLLLVLAWIPSVRRRTRERPS
jgi:phospholipase C